MGDYSIIADQNPAELWKEFFGTVLDPLQDLRQRFEKWGKAEQARVNFGIAIADGVRSKADQREQAQIDVFVWWGNQYRSLVSTGLPGRVPTWAQGANPFNPSTTASQEFVKNFGSLVVSPMAQVKYNLHH